jgi:Toastrack DUF4097
VEVGTVQAVTTTVLGPAAPRRRRGGWWVASSVFAVIMIAAGTLSAASWLARRTEVRDHTYPQAASRIEIEAGVGDVTVLPGGPGLRVHEHLVWSFVKPTIKEVWDGSVLRIDNECAAISLGPGCSVGFTLRVPAEVGLVVRTSTGDVTVRDRGGDLSLSTGTGDVTGTGLTGRRVEVRTGTGDIALRFAAAPTSVLATASTGDVDVAVPAGDPYTVRTHTSTGDVVVSVTVHIPAPRTIEARTTTGDVHIRYG